MKVLDCSIELKDSDAPFGAVESGALVTEARTLRARWLRSSETSDKDVIEVDNVDAAVAVSIVPDAH